MSPNTITRPLTTRLATLLGAGAILAGSFVGMGAPAAHADQGAMSMPTSGTITGTPNGYCRSGNSHGGFDIANVTGTPIRAAADGKVTYLGYGARSGNMITVGHAGGWATKYMHLSKYNVANGASVKKGQVIGYMGSTGNSTGPHLHLQIERNGAIVRDASLIDDFRCGSSVTAGREISYAFPGLPKTGGPVTPPSSSYPTLQQGASGAAVTQLQNLLKARGYSVTVDGQFGPATATTVRRFQGNIGTTVDGVVGPKTWGALEARAAGSTTLKQGSSGSDVTALQKALNATMGSGLTVDGQFGPATHNAVVRYQKSRGLSADGVVGTQTWAALKGGR